MTQRRRQETIDGINDLAASVETRNPTLAGSVMTRSAALPAHPERVAVYGLANAIERDRERFARDVDDLSVAIENRDPEIALAVAARLSRDPLRRDVIALLNLAETIAGAAGFLGAAKVAGLMD